mmetsp:Transcript_21349/g.43923  ORF Transcript_21349/g.43923 Transcript_21349/m.43923 type:complete len:218 (-) Transcript_21349:98-751(-)
MGKGETLVHRNGVGDSLTNVQDNSRGSTGCVQTQNSGRRKEKGRRPEGFKEDFGHLVSVLAGIEGGFRQQNRVVFGFDIDVWFGINVLPKSFHRIPSSVYYVSLVHGIFQKKRTTVLVQFLPHEHGRGTAGRQTLFGFQCATGHDAQVLGSSNLGTNHHLWLGSSGKTGFQRGCSVIDDHGLVEEQRAPRSISCCFFRRHFVDCNACCTKVTRLRSA